MSEFLERPAEPITTVVDTSEALNSTLDALAGGTGPVAFDAERAHGHRYFPKAYLFQLRRAGSGTHLVDPIAFEVEGHTDLSSLVDAVDGAEFIVHAASQDLPCMVDDQIVPASIFDTELTARLLNYPGVGLAALLEHHFGVKLRKAHSADNWSTRPLPEQWLDYAALDVELLVELRDRLAAELDAAGKTHWARQEFDHLLDSAQHPGPPPAEPWRRLSGLSDVRTRRGLAVARSLWHTRDTICRELDRPPGRLLPDAGITQLAAKVTETGPLPGRSAVREVEQFSYRGARRHLSDWLAAIAAVDAEEPSHWPKRRADQAGVGQPRSWQRHHPDAWERWQAVRPAVDARAAELDVPPANLVAPGILRDVTFHAPDDVAAALTEQGARPWQVDLVADTIRDALTITPEAEPA